MKNKYLLLLLACLWAFIIRTRGGQMKSVCILIPSYNLEDFAEGENEEEEVIGWGPGVKGRRGHFPSLPTSQSQGQGTGGVIANYSEGSEGSEGGSQPSSEHGNPLGEGSGVKGSLTDPSKPPGPNPIGGYWEWDKEDGRWEVEDDKRKRRRRKRRQVGRKPLTGNLQCDPGTVIHVEKVVLGFSIDNRCSPVRTPCQMTSTVGRQAAHCEGKTGACAVSITQKFMAHMCQRWTNYARVIYECIPDSERQNICEAKSFQSTGSLVISSPSFDGQISGSATSAHAKFLSCECEVNRGSNEALMTSWLRTRMTEGKDGGCGEELLLTETWNDATNRFTLEKEMCGVKTERDKKWTSSLVKMTFIPASTPVKDTGFLLRIQAHPNANTPLQVTCSVVPADGGPAPGAEGPPPPPAPAGAASAASSASSPIPEARTPPKLPAGFNFANINPSLLNKTLSTWRRRMAEKKQGQAAGQVGHQDSNLQPSGSAQGVVGYQEADPGREQFAVSGMSGTLSAVVASLSSIIVIMASFGVYIWYRRSQKKKKDRQLIYYDSRSTVRSDAPIYTEPTYQDPADPSSGIPTSLPIPPNIPRPAAPIPKSAAPSIPTIAAPSIPKPGLELNHIQKRQAPDLPTRPPRRQKEKVRRLPSEEDVDVAYDNNAGVTSDVKIILDEDYASLDEISQALASQDGGDQIQTEA